jgi:cysteinyl-tRNA synthetase
MASNEVDFANYWVHNGFLTVESEKMSKSLGNFITIRDALNLYHPQVLRLFLLSKQYRSPLDFSRSAMMETRSGLIRIYRTLQRVEEIIGPYNQDTQHAFSLLEGDHGFKDHFITVMDDDLNTAAGLGLLFDKVRDINKIIDSPAQRSNKKSQLVKEREDLLVCSKVLGLLEERPSQFFQEIQQGIPDVAVEEIERMITERQEARKVKDWMRADAIRDELFGKGVILEDGPQGTSWRLRIDE